MRINGFEQIKAFYTIVFSQEFDIKPQHISLYVFLINQNNRNNWVEWFKCPLDLAMAGACIGSKKTYYACLKDLKEWNLLQYEQGENLWKSPKIKLEVLNSTTNDYSTVPQSEQVPIQLPALVPIQLDTPNIKPTTNNLQPVTGQKKGQNRILPIKLTLEERLKKFQERLSPFKEKYDHGMLLKFYEYWTEKNEAGTKMLFEFKKTFDMAYRLRTWKSNKGKFNNENNGKSTIGKTIDTAQQWLIDKHGPSALDKVGQG